MSSLFGYLAGDMGRLHGREAYKAGLMGERCRRAAVEASRAARRDRRMQIMRLAFLQPDPVDAPGLERVQ